MPWFRIITPSLLNKSLFSDWPSSQLRCNVTRIDIKSLLTMPGLQIYKDLLAFSERKENCQIVVGKLIISNSNCLLSNECKDTALL